MRKILLLLLTAIMILAAIGPTSSQAAGGAGWTAWFYNPDLGHVLRVGVPDSDPGNYTVQELDVSLFLRGGASPINTKQLEMSFSPEQELIAYCTGGAFDDNFSPNPISLVIFDPFALQFRQQIALGSGVLCSHSMQGWSIDERFYAFGVLYQSIYQATQNPPVGPTWEVMVLDLTTGQFVNRIPNSDPAFSEQTSYDYALPKVNFFAPGNNIGVTFRFFATDGPLFDVPAITMAYGSGSLIVQDAPLSGKFLSDTLGGALIWADRDPAFTEVFYEGFGAPANVIKYSDKTGVQRVIFHTDNSLVSSALFIDNGAQVAFGQYDANFNPLGWRAMNRSGQQTVLSIPGDTTYHSQWGGNIIGTPLGYLYLRAQGTPQAEVYVGNGSDTLLWSNASLNWQLVGSEALEGTGFADFPAISPPVAQPNTCPGTLPSRLTGLSVARVTPGPANNVRAQPSLAGTRSGQIPGSGTVALLGGPVCADNMTWWQVDYNGLVGWTSEGDANGYWMEPVN